MIPRNRSKDSSIDSSKSSLKNSTKDVSKNFFGKSSRSFFQVSSKLLSKNFQHSRLVIQNRYKSTSKDLSCSSSEGIHRKEFFPSIFVQKKLRKMFERIFESLSGKILKITVQEGFRLPENSKKNSWRNSRNKF